MKKIFTLMLVGTMVFCMGACGKNETNENIGARRLHSIMESLLEDVSFNATGDHPVIVITVDKKYVDEHLDNICKKFDLRKYIL